MMAAMLVVLASGAASASTVPVMLATEPACEPGKLGASPPCAVEGDVTELAAELLVVKFGGDAPAFAMVRANRYATEDDPESAKFWHEIADLTVEKLKSRMPERRFSTILSK
jgi:hypothetical protein